jgi:hypothetical protein
MCVILAATMFLLSASPVLATTRSVGINSGRTNLVGIAVLRFNSVTTWSYSNNTLANPKSLSYSYWTAPPTWFSSGSSSWAWYSYYYGGNAQSIQRGNFVFGVPTPWGPVGASNSLVHVMNAYSNGAYDWYCY